MGRDPAIEDKPHYTHHLTIASRTDTLFSDDATTLIHQTSRGYPRGHCQLVELRAVDGHVEPGLGSRVDLRSGAQAAAVAMPVTSFQVANRVPISRRYSSAVSR